MWTGIKTSCEYLLHTYNIFLFLPVDSRLARSPLLWEKYNVNPSSYSTAAVALGVGLVGGKPMMLGN